MKNGPELWDKILSHFPEDTILAGGAVRDFFLGVEPKDFDLFSPYSSYKADIEGMNHIDFDDGEGTHAEEYEAMGEIGIVMKGEIEGVNVDYIGMHLDDPVAMIESFDTDINQVFFARGGRLYKKAGFIKALETKIVTVQRGDRLERTQERFDRFNLKMHGQFTLVVPEGLAMPEVTNDPEFNFGAD